VIYVHVARPETVLGMSQVDRMGTMLHVNPAMSTLLGYDADTLLGRTPDLVMAAEGRERLFA
jgi:PAS domain S-box-containing protein